MGTNDVGLGGDASPVDGQQTHTTVLACQRISVLVMLVAQDRPVPKLIKRLGRRCFLRGTKKSVSPSTPTNDSSIGEAI